MIDLRLLAPVTGEPSSYFALCSQGHLTQQDQFKVKAIICFMLFQFKSNKLCTFAKSLLRGYSRALNTIMASSHCTTGTGPGQVEGTEPAQ